MPEDRLNFAIPPLKWPRWRLWQGWLSRSKGTILLLKGRLPHRFPRFANRIASFLSMTIDWPLESLSVSPWVWRIGRLLVQNHSWRHRSTDILLASPSPPYTRNIFLLNRARCASPVDSVLLASHCHSFSSDIIRLYRP